MTRLCCSFLASLPFVVAACSDSAALRDADTGLVELTITLENIAQENALVSADSQSHPVAFAPAIRVLHPASPMALMEVGAPASAELEELAEDGNPSSLAAALDALPDIEARAVARIDMSTYQESPIEPGTLLTFDVAVAEGQRISIASMFGQSNDIFVAALDVDPLPMGQPAGDVTELFSYFDAGTEHNEEPGTGPNQAPRQSTLGAGADENGVVTELVGDVDVEDYTYPAIPEVLKITIASGG